MAKTKDQLRTENNASFPNNNSQFITPEKIRDYNTDVIDSVALEVNPQLSGEGTFGSLSGSSFVSASTYYGDGSNLTGVNATVPAGTVSGSSQIILDDTTGDLSGSRITGSVDTSISASFATTASFALNATPIDTGSFARTDIANNFTGSNNTFPMQFDLRPTNSAPNDDSRFRFDSFQNRMQISLVSDDTFFDREIRFYPSASYAAGFPQDSELGLKITEDGVFGFGNKLSLTNTSGDDLGGFVISGSDDGDSFVIELSDTKIMEYNYDDDFIILENINARGGIDAQGASNFLGGLTVQNSFSAPLTQGNVYVGNATGTTSEVATGSLSVAFAQDAEDLIIGVKNTSGVTLPKGTPVYATGVTGENINIESASNASSATMPAIGLLNEELTPNAAGQAVLNGRIVGVNTAGFTAGQPVYVNSDGDFTQTKPTGSSLIQNVGVVGKVNSNEGEIVVIGAGRSNDLPNITEGYLWVGDGNGVPTSQPTSSFARTDVANDFTGSNNTFPLQFDLRPTNSPASGDPRLRFDSFQNRMQISLVAEDTFFDREIRFYPSASYSPGYPQDSELGASITEDGLFSFGKQLNITDNTGDILAGFEVSSSDEGISYVTYLSNEKVMEYNQDSDFIIHNNINARGGFTSTADSIVKSLSTTAFTVSSGDGDLTPIVMEGGADFVTKFTPSKISGVEIVETGLIQNSVNDFQMGSGIPNGRGIYNSNTGSTSDSHIILQHRGNPSVENLTYQSFSSQPARLGVESQLILKGTEVSIQASTGSKQTSVDIDGDVTASNLNISEVINLTEVDPLPTGNVGDLAVSSSQLYFYNGAWTQIS